LVDSVNTFDLTCNVSWSAPLHHERTPSGVPFIVLSILWMKTTHGEGANIVASGVDNVMNPVLALIHHLSANYSMPADAPFFAFETDTNGWAPMTCSWFMERCNTVWKMASLPQLSGHCFRIGGATELLLQDTQPDVVAMQGRWKSWAFLEYWRKINLILPMFITLSLLDSCIAMVQSSMSSFSHHYQ
jgi:hypothetical protein